MKQEVVEQSNLRADAPAFTPTFTPQFSPELINAARNHASQLAQMKQAFALHPFLQQALFLQSEMQQQQHLQAQSKTKKKTKTKQKSKDSYDEKAKAVQQEEGSKAKPYKRVIAINLPAELQSIDAVTSVFHPYGDVTLVRVLKPGKVLPFDTKQYAAKIPELGTVPCALVDFETARAAKFAVHVLRQRADEVGFRLAILKPGVEDKLYSDDDIINKHHHRHHKIIDSDDQTQIDSGVTGSETSDESRSISDGDVDSDLNNSRASISSEDETQKTDNHKTLDIKRHSITSDTDHSVDYHNMKHSKKQEKKHDKNRVVSSVTIFLKSPKETTGDKQKYFTRDELLNLQHPCPNLNNPFGHIFDEIERNTASIMKEMVRSEKPHNHHHQKQHTKRTSRKITGKRFHKQPNNKPSGFLVRA